MKETKEEIKASELSSHTNTYVPDFRLLMRIVLKHIFLCLLFPSALLSQERTIDYFLQQGLTNSPLLKEYRNQVQDFLLDSEKIRASYRPQVTGSSNNSYAPVINGFGYDYAITNGANVSALVGVNKTFVGRKNLENQFQALEINSLGVRNTAGISEQELKRTIISQYIVAYGDQQQLSFLSQVLSLLQKEDTVLKTLTQNNVYRQTDYLTFLVTKHQQELLTHQLLVQLQNNYAILNYVCGIEDTAVTQLRAPDISLQTVPESTTSVFYRKYILDSLKIINQRKSLDLSYRPKFSVFGDAGYISSLAGYAYRNFGTSFGFGLSFPIYDGKQKRIMYKKLDISENTRQGYKQFFLKQYNQQITLLMNQLKGTEQLISEINQQIRYSEGLVDANVKLLMTGDARITDLVIALNNYMTAKNILTQNNVNRWQIINQINYWTR